MPENVAYNHEQTELYLFTRNTGYLAPMFLQVRLNLLRKIRADRYNSALAVKAWFHVVNHAAKCYITEHCHDGQKWSDLFSEATRRDVAKELRDEFEREVNNGELNYILDLKGKGV